MATIGDHPLNVGEDSHGRSSVFQQDKAPIAISVSWEGLVFGALRDDLKYAQNMGIFNFGQLVQVGDDAVEFGAEVGYR